MCINTYHKHFKLKLLNFLLNFPPNRVKLFFINVVLVYKIHRVDQMQHYHFSRVDQVGIDQMGIDQMGVDQMGVDQMGINRINYQGHCR